MKKPGVGSLRSVPSRRRFFFLKSVTPGVPGRGLPVGNAGRKGMRPGLGFLSVWPANPANRQNLWPAARRRTDKVGFFSSGRAGRSGSGSSGVAGVVAVSVPAFKMSGPGPARAKPRPTGSTNVPAVRSSP